MARWYYLGPWQQDADHVWVPPAGTVGLVDLRPLAPTANYGFFATDQPLTDSSYQAFGDSAGNRLEDLRPTATQKTRWRSMLGLTSISGTSLLDLLWNTLTVQADPDGATRALPILPTHAGYLELHLGGHSLVRRERINRGHAAFGKIQKVLQQQYRRIREWAQGSQRGDAERKLHLKWLECQRRKLGLSAEEATGLLVPDDLPKEKPARPTTTIRDDFNRPDASPISPSSEGWSWLSHGGILSIANNACIATAPGYFEAVSSLSSDDHQVAITATTAGATGAIGRYDADGDNQYRAQRTSAVNITSVTLYKRVGSSETALGNDGTNQLFPIRVALVCDGCTIKTAATVLATGTRIERTYTDTSVVGFLRTGLRIGTVGKSADDFEAFDLVASAITPSTTAILASLFGRRPRP
mgnify:CR=1 FL=1